MSFRNEKIVCVRLHTAHSTHHFFDFLLSFSIKKYNNLIYK